MSLEKLGGRNLAIDHANHVFEGKMDKICQKVGGGDHPPCPLGSYAPVCIGNLIIIKYKAVEKRGAHGQYFEKQIFVPQILL